MTDKTMEPEATRQGITVKPLRWADEEQHLVSSQKDGQVEFFTLCHRYTVRIRAGAAGTMFVARYLKHNILEACPSLAGAKKAAFDHHVEAVFADIDIAGEAGAP